MTSPGTVLNGDSWKQNYITPPPHTSLYTPLAPIATRHTLQWLKAELFSWESCHTSITTRRTVIKTKLFSWESCLCAKSCKLCISQLGENIRGQGYWVSHNLNMWNYRFPSKARRWPSTYLICCHHCRYRIKKVNQHCISVSRLLDNYKKNWYRWTSGD